MASASARSARLREPPPYSSTSAFAGNPLLISLERLAEYGWISASKIDTASAALGPVEYDHVFTQKMPLLFEAARAFLSSGSNTALQRFQEFRTANAWWLDDFVLFDALRAKLKLASWNQWPRELASRESSALDKARKELAADIEIRSALQFAFYEQWRALRQYAAKRAIRIVGDVAIFVNHDSADVWTHRELFRLDDNLEPEVVAGVPPDFFSKTGQRWGNPLYRWDVMKDRGYEWWIQRLRWATQNCDYIRLDHFRGFDQFWETDGGRRHGSQRTLGRRAARRSVSQTARSSRWSALFCRGSRLYHSRSARVARAASDSRHGRVALGFGDEGSHMYLPHRSADKVIYTGTHDNDTTAGWWKSGASEQERRNAEAYLGRCDDGIHWALIRAAQCSPASLSIIPLQDVLGLGSDCRMNTPSLDGGNWRWRFDSAQLTGDLSAKLAQLAEMTDRLPKPFTSPGDDAFSA